MKLKLKLYICFFVLFTFVFSQIAFPLSAKITSISIKQADSDDSLPVFGTLVSDGSSSDNVAHEVFIKDAEFKEAKYYHFLEYVVDVDSTSLIPLDILDSKLTIDEKYKDRVIVRLLEPYDKVVSTVKSSNKRFLLLVDTSLMTREEIRDMVENITVYINWRALPGWERKNKVYLSQDTLAFKS